MSAVSLSARPRARAMIARAGERLGELAEHPVAHRLVARSLPAVLARRFDPSRARHLEATFELRLRGPRPARFAITIGSGRCRIVPGDAPGAGAAVELGADDALALISGACGWPELLANGRLTMSGDPFLALRFPMVFALPSDPASQRRHA
jgi:hypothetical protein